MNIIVDEKSWAEDVLSGNLKPTSQMLALVILGKYYIEKGDSTTALRKDLEGYLSNNGYHPESIVSQGMIDKAIVSAKKAKLFIMTPIHIKAEELAKIDSLKNAQARRLAFTLLCLSRYFDQRYESGEGWVTIEDCKIMQMANIKTSIERQTILYNQLAEARMVRFAHKVDDCKMQVIFRGGKDDILEIKDLRNLGYQYMALTQDGFHRCVNCGLTFKTPPKDTPRGRKIKYCEDCAKKIAIRQRVEWMANKRKEVKS